MRLVRPALIASIALIASLSLAGCVSSAAAGWTFAPPPSATPVPSATGSEVPSAAASAAPGGSAAASGAATDVTISADNIAFEQSSVNAPAGRAFTILFDNKDASVPHDVYIKDSTGTQVFMGAIVTGPAQTTYNVPSLAAGTYTFFCTIHSNMTGTMVVQ